MERYTNTTSTGENKAAADSSSRRSNSSDIVGESGAIDDCSVGTLKKSNVTFAQVSWYHSNFPAKGNRTQCNFSP
jgi:hypothetical protein